MKTVNYAPQLAQVSAAGFDLFRISRAKVEVGCSPNTLRKYFQQGLPYYQRDKSVWVSRSQFAAFIMSAQGQPQAKATA